MMMLRSSPAKDHKKDSPLKSQGIIKDSAKERCCFTDPLIDRIRHCFPADTVFKTFDSTVLSDSVSETWVAFPVTPFTIGYTYPFPDFTQSFFSLTGLSYIQAMPMIWRVLYTLERIIEHEGIDLGMSELAEMYDLVSYGSHRYLLKHKPGEKHPILKVTKNDTNWKKRFFFVKRDTIPNGGDLPRKWATHVIIDSHITPATKERLTAFQRLDPEIRSFQANTQDSQEVSSGSVTMSSAGKTSKSASRFSVTDLDHVAPRSGKKKSAASPSAVIPKPTVSKGKKRKATEADKLVGLPLWRHQFEEYFSEKYAELEEYLGSMEEIEQKNLELQKMLLAKDKKIASLENDVTLVKRELVLAHAVADQEKAEVTEDAKVSAAIAMYKIKIQMAQEAGDPAFDRSNWDLEGWKAKLADLDDEEEAGEVLAIEAGSSGAKGHAGGDEAGGDGEGDAAKV